MLRSKSQILSALLPLILAACSDDSDSPPPVAPEPVNPYLGYSSATYDAPDNWLCRPDISEEGNVCLGDLTATVVFADGSTQLEFFNENPSPEADCFYIYPTISRDPEINSDFNPGLEQVVAYLQAARYRGVCQIYAPVHRQITSGSRETGEVRDENLDIAYGDVVDAFQQFIANHEGRPFFLLTHSQGTGYGIRLIQEEIETNAYLSERMVAAHLIGLNVARPLDAELGASFENTPPCTPEQETGCYVNYSTFYADSPPDESATFGYTDDPDTRPSCTQPVDLGVGPRTLSPYFTIVDFLPYEDPAQNANITTQFFTLPDRVVGECIDQDGLAYLAISVNDSPDDALIDNVGPEDFPGWGIHNSDIPMAQGDLVRLAERQLDEWLQQNR